MAKGGKLDREAQSLTLRCEWHTAVVPMPGRMWQASTGRWPRNPGFLAWPVLASPNSVLGNL